MRSMPFGCCESWCLHWSTFVYMFNFNSMNHFPICLCVLHAIFIWYIETFALHAHVWHSVFEILIYLSIFSVATATHHCGGITSCRAILLFLLLWSMVLCIFRLKSKSYWQWIQQKHSHALSFIHNWYAKIKWHALKSCSLSLTLSNKRIIEYRYLYIQNVPMNDNGI